MLNLIRVHEIVYKLGVGVVLSSDIPNMYAYDPGTHRVFTLSWLVFLMKVCVALFNVGVWLVFRIKHSYSFQY